MNDRCPNCNGELNTGGYCFCCGFNSNNTEKVAYFETPSAKRTSELQLIIALLRSIDTRLEEIRVRIERGEE